MHPVRSISMSTYQASHVVEAARMAGVAECRRGHFDQGCLSNTSPAGKQFASAYGTWMRLRAQAGDKFALSLGYGSSPQTEGTL